MFKYALMCYVFICKKQLHNCFICLVKYCYLSCKQMYISLQHNIFYRICAIAYNTWKISYITFLKLCYPCIIHLFCNNMFQLIIMKKIFKAFVTHIMSTVMWQKLSLRRTFDMCYIFEICNFIYLFFLSCNYLQIKY